MSDADSRQEVHVRADVLRLGGAVRQRRRDLDLTQEELAQLAGVSTRFVHSVENGKATVQLAPLLGVLAVLGLGLHLGPGDGTITSHAP